MFKVLFTLFGIYVLYRFIFNFVIPVQKNIQHIKKNFDDINNRSRSSDFQEPKQSTKKTDERVNPKHNGEYIDFEEVKSK
ncbi:MAG: hypothetical protein QM539_04855 [Alphaproteobacteria bacterium]|nr:hypothetical protein [Alphaproteobacteria bacterium]